MPRDSSVYLEDIVTAVERIATYATEHTGESFRNDAKTGDAVVGDLAFPRHTQMRQGSRKG